MKIRLGLLPLLTLLACSSSETPMDASAPRDGGVAPRDAGAVAERDGGTVERDGGASVDAGMPSVIDFFVRENFTDRRLTDVEVCMRSSSGGETCETISNPNGVAFRGEVGERVHFVVRKAGYQPVAIPETFRATRHEAWTRLLDDALTAQILARTGVTIDPTKGHVAFFFDRFGAQDPAVVQQIEFEPNDAAAQVVYFDPPGVEDFDPDLTATSTGSEYLGGGYAMNWTPGVSTARARHPLDPSCEPRNVWWNDAGDAFEFEVFEGVFTSVFAYCPESDRGIYECSFVDQDCAGATDECRVRTFVGLDGYDEAGTYCAPIAGNEMLDAMCTRVDDRPGHDDCAAGLFCTAAGSCRPACDLDNGCGVDGSCLSFGQREPTPGYCAVDCDPFADPCAAGQHCAVMFTTALRDQNNLTTCVPDGSATRGDLCATSEDCATNLSCVFDGAGIGTCSPLCDPTNACPAMETCTPIGRSTHPGLGACR